MKENIQIVFGLLGGLAVFIYGMNMMSESLQKVAGDKMKKVLGVLTRKNEENPVTFNEKSCNGSTCGNACYSRTAKFKCNDGYGDWFCKCRTDDTATGNFYYFWCQYRYNNDSTADCI